MRITTRIRRFTSGAFCVRDVGVEAVVPHLHNLVVGVACLGQGHDLILLQGSGTLVIPILRGARAELILMERLNTGTTYIITNCLNSLKILL